MKIPNCSRVAVLGGVLGVALAACAAQTEDGTPVGTGGGAVNAGGAGASGSAPSGTAGSSSSAGSPASSSAGSPSSAGGATKPSGGSSGSFLPPEGASGSSAGSNTGPGSPGAGGSFSPGSSAGGATTGSAGALTVGGCVAAMGTATDLLIDDLDDHDNAISRLGQRVGYWYTYNDGSGVQVPAPTAVFVPAGAGHSAMYAAETSGPAFTTYGAGMGFDFNNAAMKPCVYNGSAYTGIKFWAKASAPVTLKAMIKIAATTPAASGGSCAGVGCEDHFALTPAPMLTTAWTEYTMLFTALAQGGWGLKATFDKSTLLGMQFQVDKGVAFDISIDDVTFY